MKHFFQNLLNDFHENNDQTNQKISGHSMELAASVIFLEMAAMDRDIAEVELLEISKILQTQYSLTDLEAAEMLKNAEIARKSAVDIFQFTRSINEICSRADKQMLMEQIWRIVYADGRLDKHEDHLAHKLARLLHINHQDMIDAKLKARSKS